MRHFLCVTYTPAALTRCMPTGATIATLVAFSGTKQRLSPADLSTDARAIEVSAVTAPADLHLLAAAPTVIQPMSWLTHPPCTFHRGWTTPCIAGIKEARMRTFYGALAC